MHIEKIREFVTGLVVKPDDNHVPEGAALAFLESNPLLHMGMIFPIMRGTAEILYAEGDGVLLRELASGAYMLSACDFEKGRELLRPLGRRELFCVHQGNISDWLAETYAFANRLACFQAVHTSGRRFAEDPAIEVRQLGVEYLDILYSYYHDYVGYDYLKRRLESGGIYGGFLGETLCGFVGTHEEGSIGILEVLDAYRGRGFGSALEKFMINRILEEGQIPFAQISVDNQTSINLQRKLGLEISSDRVYWLF